MSLIQSRVCWMVLALPLALALAGCGTGGGLSVEPPDAPGDPPPDDPPPDDPPPDDPPPDDPPPPDPQQVCDAGEQLCGDGELWTCADDGLSWGVDPCEADQLCFDLACVWCVRDANCDDGEVCLDGSCEPAPPFITTVLLPNGQVDSPYEFRLEAEDAEPDAEWAVVGGMLPDGLALSEDGLLSGIPEVSQTSDFEVRVMDEGGSGVAAFSLDILGEGLVITTPSELGLLEEGTFWSTELEATGGTAPYGWFLLDGALPEGLSLDSGGTISGTPSDVGPFGFTARAVDAATPPGFAQRDFTLEVEVAPLRVTGDTIYDIFITQVVVLPLITVVEGIPVPYGTSLQATGGLRPLAWEETPIPGALDFWFPGAGIPEGLELSEDGTLSGAVSDTSQIIELSIPFTGINLTGFFFTAQVTDSNDPMDSDDALFLMPTIPIGG